MTMLSRYSGQKKSKIIKDADRNYWMTAIQAKDYGLIDAIIRPNKK